MKSIVICQLFFAFSLNLFCQENRIPRSFSEYADSIENRLRSNSDNPASDLKHFKRWRYLMQSKVANDDVAAYYEAKRKYRATKSSVFKSSNVDNIEWDFFGPIGIPGTPASGSSARSTGKGWVYSINIDESDTDNILAGTHNGGLWKTENHGNSWTPLTDDYADIYGIVSMLKNGNDIIVCSHNDHHTYAWSEGLFRSTDGGNSWSDYNNDDLSSIYPAFGETHLPRKLYRNPFNSSEIFYLTYSSLYKSTNNGSTWTELFSHTNTCSSEIGYYGFFDMEIIEDYMGYEKIYISGSKVYMSDDGGYSWDNLNSEISDRLGLSNICSFQRVDMATNTQYTGKVWFHISYNDRTYILKWTGFTYEPLADRANSSDNRHKLEIEVSPNDEDIVYTAGLEIAKYDGSTGNWANISDGWLEISDGQIQGGTNWVHHDIRDLKIIDNSGVDRIYAAHDGGISWGEWDTSISHDYNFHHIGDDSSNGLYNTQFWGFDVADNASDFVIGGCQDLSIFSYGSPGYTNSWIHSGAGDGAYTHINQDNKDQIYCLDFFNNSVRRSMDGGISFSSIGASVDPTTRTQIAQDPNSTNILYIGDKNEIRKTENAWVAAPTSPTFNSLYPPMAKAGKFICAIEVDPNNSNIFYAASNDVSWNHYNIDYDSIMWQYNNGTWTSISENVQGSLDQSPFEVTYVTDIEINPNNSSELWICFSGARFGSDKVFHSENAGSTWEPLSYGYPADVPANSLCYDFASDLIYVSTDVGIFYYDENYGWTSFGTGLPDVIITGMDINHVNGTMFVATYGRGIWKADLPEVNCYDPDGDINITSNTTWFTDDIKCGDITISDGATLTITADIFQNPRYQFTIESGSELVINGGILETGIFTIELGGEFHTESGGEIIIGDEL